MDVQSILGALGGTVMVNDALSMVVLGSFGWSPVTGRLFALSHLKPLWSAPRYQCVSILSASSEPRAVFPCSFTFLLPASTRAGLQSKQYGMTCTVASLQMYLLLVCTYVLIGRQKSNTFDLKT